MAKTVGQRQTSEQPEGTGQSPAATHTAAAGQRTCPTRLVRHSDVVAAATNPEAFSSATSSHLHVPNTMDGEEHRVFREIVDRYMAPDVVASLEPMFAEVAAQIVADLPRGSTVDAVTDFGSLFAVRAQCRWLGWPQELEEELLTWMQQNEEAAREGDPARNAAVAEAFDGIVRRQVEVRRRAEQAGTPMQDVTAQLLEETVYGRPLSVEEIVSMLRNWTAGDLSSLARCVGVVVTRLIEEPVLQERVRELASASGEQSPTTARGIEEFEAIIDECLRIVDPFASNRRVTTCPVSLPSGQEFDADHHVLLDWAAANRDSDVFDGEQGPDTFRPREHRPDNLVYGAGPHACPGRTLSTVELRLALSALLSATTSLSPAQDESPVPAEAPLLGWARVPIVLG